MLRQLPYMHEQEQSLVYRVRQLPYMHEQEQSLVYRVCQLLCIKYEQSFNQSCLPTALHKVWTVF